MIRCDETALICDFAEVYRIYDYRSLPLLTAAAYFMGLRQDSRCKMLISGQKHSLETMLAAMIYDKLAWLQWAKTKDGSKGVNMPRPIAAKLFGEDTDEEMQGFTSIEEFEAERKRILGGGSQ